MQMRTLEAFPGEVTRRQIHQYYRKIEPFLPEAEVGEKTFSSVIFRVKTAISESTGI